MQNPLDKVLDLLTQSGLTTATIDYHDFDFGDFEITDLFFDTDEVPRARYNEFMELADNVKAVYSVHTGSGTGRFVVCTKCQDVEWTHTVTTEHFDVGFVRVDPDSAELSKVLDLMSSAGCVKLEASYNGSGRDVDLYPAAYYGPDGEDLSNVPSVSDELYALIKSTVPEFRGTEDASDSSHGKISISTDGLYPDVTWRHEKYDVTAEEPLVFVMTKAADGYWCSTEKLIDSAVAYAPSDSHQMQAPSIS